MDILIRDKRIRLTASKMIGSGGEAEIYDIGGGEVAKIFKRPSHPDFSGNPSAIQAAEDRITEHQMKLTRFPRTLPREVVAPTSLIVDFSGKKIVGYTMRYLTGMEVLLKYGERKYRETHGISPDGVVQIFQNLHTLVGDVHTAGAVIGDFNDLNVLVDPSMRTSLVDADSMQFGKFLSRVFTARFVDPLLCDPHAQAAHLSRPHTTMSDWYAYHVMLMQSLLFVGPYGGVHTPSDVSKKLREWQRVQRRVTIFSPDVRYPKPAWHYSILPDDLLDHFHKVFERDVREEPSKYLLQGLRFTTCPACQRVHARSSCPDCQSTTLSMTREVVTGSIEAMKILDTTGRIIYTTMQSGIPRYIYHESGSYYREGGRKVLDGKLDPSIRWRISGDATIIAKAGQVIILEKNGVQKPFVADLFRDRVTVVDANATAVYTVQGEALKKFTPSNIEYADTLGTVLSGQTMVWVSDTLGFVFSRAGGFTQAYVFHTSGKTLGTEVDIGRITGQVLDATVVFSLEYVWLLLALQEGTERINRAYMYDQYGKLCGQAETSADDGSWLGSIRGKCAVGRQLFSPTDDGMVRIETTGGSLAVTKVFVDTTRFVDSASRLMFGKDGVYVADTSRIWRLRMK